MVQYPKRMKELARQIAQGQSQLTHNDLKEIATALDFSKFKKEFLPSAQLADKSPKKSKHYSIIYISRLWNITPEKLMKLETKWLKAARQISGSSKNDDKDVPDDLVTPQIVSRIIALAYFIYQVESGEMKMAKKVSQSIIRESLIGINVFLANPTLKGRVRMTKIRVGKKMVNAYDFLMSHGVLVGYYGKFLPNPTVSLPYIFSLFSRSKLREEVYK